MVLFGLYMVPRRHSQMSQARFMVFMAFGVLAGSALFGLPLAHNLRVEAAQWPLAFAGGLIWAIGVMGYSCGVQLIGLSRSTPIKNTTAILGTAYGIAVFREFTVHDPAAMTMAIAGSSAIVASAILLGSLTSPEEQQEPIPRRTLMIGISASLVGAIGFSAYAIPMKIAYQHGMTPAGFLFFMGQGCFVGMSLIATIARRRSCTEFQSQADSGLLPVLAGLTWAAASVCANTAVKLVGIAVTWPLSNLNTVVAVAYGVWVLHEVRVAEHRRELYVGLAAATVGVALLAVATGR